MKTNNVENQTKGDASDSAEEITKVPRPIVAMAKDFPNGHLIPFHQHDRSQLLYASSGVMTVTRTSKALTYQLLEPGAKAQAPIYSGRKQGRH